MDYLKYFKNIKYVKGENDCWTFIQDIFKEEHNIILPDNPICLSDSGCKSYLKENIKFKIVSNAKKGFLAHVSYKNIEHIGYCVDSKNYIHKSYQGVLCSLIPKYCIFYEVIQ